MYTHTPQDIQRGEDLPEGRTYIVDYCPCRVSDSYGRRCSKCFLRRAVIVAQYCSISFLWCSLLSSVRFSPVLNLSFSWILWYFWSFILRRSHVIPISCVLSSQWTRPPLKVGKDLVVNLIGLICFT